MQVHTHVSSNIGGGGVANDGGIWGGPTADNGDIGVTTDDGVQRDNNWLWGYGTGNNW